jgi:hypothetical protein
MKSWENSKNSTINSKRKMKNKDDSDKKKKRDGRF